MSRAAVRNKPSTPALKEVVTRGLKPRLTSLRHSREGLNPPRAMDPRLRKDDGWLFFLPLRLPESRFFHLTARGADQVDKIGLPIVRQQR